MTPNDLLTVQREPEASRLDPGDEPEASRLGPGDEPKASRLGPGDEPKASRLDRSRAPLPERRWIGSLGRGDLVDGCFALRKVEIRARPVRPTDLAPLGSDRRDLAPLGSDRRDLAPLGSDRRDLAPFLAVELQDRTGVVAGRFPLPPGLAVATVTATVDLLRASPFVRVRGCAERVEVDDRRPTERATDRPDGGPGREPGGDARGAGSEGTSGDRRATVRPDLVLELTALASASHAEVEPRDLFEHSPEDPDRLLGELRTTFEDEVSDPFVLRLLLSFLDDSTLVAKLRTAPAASSYHHAYLGGLVEHIHSLTRLAVGVCAAYPRLDRSLVLAGIFLHDVGKVDELSWERGLAYTDRGQLVGHIAIGLLLLEEKIRAIEGFPDRLRDALAHLVLSHHGTKEFGSPVLPATPEAFAVHYLDNLDGKLWSAWRAIDDPRGDRDWTAYSRHLGRKLFRG